MAVKSVPTLDEATGRMHEKHVPEYLTQAAQNATYGPDAEPMKAAYQPQGNRDHTALAKLGLGSPVQTWAVASDSTGVGPDKWAEQAFLGLGADSPRTRARVMRWDDPSQSYAVNVIGQEAVATRANVFTDEFARSGELIGSTPNVGGVWVGQSANATGDFTLDGSKAVASSDTTRAMALAPLGGTGNVEITAVGTLPVPATSANLTVYLKWIDNSNNLYGIVSRDATNLQLQIMHRIAGAYTTLITIPSMAPPADGVVTMKGQCIGDKVTWTVNGVTAAATLSPDAVTAFANSTQSGLTSSASAGSFERFQVDSVTVPVSPPTVTLYNGCMSGSILSYQQARLPLLYPVKPDVLIVNSCHNYAGGTVQDYLTALDSFVNAFHALHPGVGVVVTSQNPEFSPVLTTAEHLARNAALRAHCTLRNWGYIPAGEAFGAALDNGKSLIRSDGLHPTYGGNGGAGLWAKAALTYFRRPGR